MVNESNRQARWHARCLLHKGPSCGCSPAVDAPGFHGENEYLLIRKAVCPLLNPAVPGLASPPEENVSCQFALCSNTEPLQERLTVDDGKAFGHHFLAVFHHSSMGYPGAVPRLTSHTITMATLVVSSAFLCFLLQPCQPSYTSSLCGFMARLPGSSRFGGNSGAQVLPAHICQPHQPAAATHPIPNPCGFFHTALTYFPSSLWRHTKVS